jgi:hypothetical protein
MNGDWDERRSIARWEALHQNPEPPMVPAAVGLPRRGCLFVLVALA